MKTLIFIFQNTSVSKKVLYLAILIGSIWSCKTQNSTIKHQSIGAPGELLLVMDNNLKESPISNSIIEFANQEFPSLPQPESLFKVTKINKTSFQKHFRTYRNILQVNLNTGIASSIVNYKKDTWASDQRIVEISIKDYTDFIPLFKENYKYIKSFLYNGDIETMCKENKRGADAASQKIVKEKHGIELSIPQGYRLVSDTANFTWFRFDEREIIKSIAITTFNLDTLEELNENKLIELSDYVGKNFIPGAVANSYMTTEKRLPVLFNNIEENDNAVWESRGLWKMEGFFMGGPFVNNYIVNKKNNTLVLVQTFVYAPQKQNKALYVRQLESILYDIHN